MKPFKPPSFALANASYAVCRHGGAPPGIARSQLGLPADTAVRLEQRFQARPCGGPDAMRPRFARHIDHVDAVLAEGGYPALAERQGR